MKRIRATLKPKEGNFGKILNAFFEDQINMLNEGTKIYVKEGKLYLEVVFEEFPLKIIKVISECTLEEVESFDFWMNHISSQSETRVGQNNQGDTQEETSDESLIGDNSSQEVFQQDLPQDVAEVDGSFQEQEEEEPQRVINPEPSANVTTRKWRPKRTASISSMPELDEILKNTNSFEEFVSEVIKWAGIGKKSEYFKNLLTICEEEKDLTWKSIAKAMDERKISYIKNDELFCRKQLGKKLENSGYNFVALEFIKIVLRYKEKFSSSVNQVNSQEVPGQEVKVGEVKKGTQRETVKSEEIQEQSVETNSKFLPCMPIIPGFDEKISEMELEWSAKEKAEYILEVMGVNSEGVSSKNNILNFVNEALEVGEATFLQMFDEKSKEYSCYIMERVILSKFIASYVKPYSEETVQVFDFLSDLRKLVIS